MPVRVIDVSEYTRVPQMDVPTTYSLGCKLLSAVPTGTALTDQIRQSALGMREAAIFLRDAWTASLKHGPADRRAFDVVADASWRSLYYALYAVSLRSGTPEDDEDAKVAQIILNRVFADGLSFTQLTYMSQWAHADRLITEIDRVPEADEEPEPAQEPGKALAVTIDRLVGDRSLAFVRRAHAAYGDALEITKARKHAPAGVREPKRLLEVAIVQYVITLFAAHPPNSSDEKNEILAKALLPIDQVRAEQSRTPAQPAQPVPPPVVPPPEPMGPPPEDPIPDVPAAG